MSCCLHGNAGQCCGVYQQQQTVNPNWWSSQGQLAQSQAAAAQLQAQQQNGLFAQRPLDVPEEVIERIADAVMRRLKAGGT